MERAGAMNLAAAKFVIDLITLLASAGAVIYAFVVSKSKANKDEIVGHATILSNHADRITKIETLVEPVHGDIEILHRRISGLNDKVSTLNVSIASATEAIDGLKRIATTLTDHHLVPGKDT